MAFIVLASVRSRPSQELISFQRKRLMRKGQEQSTYRPVIFYYDERG